MKLYQIFLLLGTAFPVLATDDTGVPTDIKTDSGGTRGEGHYVSQNPKAPLTGAQMNALPADVQANVQRMLSARTVATYTHRDGTKSRVYKVDDHNHAQTMELEKRQQQYNKLAESGKDVTEAGTPLAEAALKSTGQAFYSYPMQNEITVHNLGDVKEAAFQASKEKKDVSFYFENSMDFITHYDQYQPYLRSWLAALEVDFHGVTLTPQDFVTKLKTFFRAFSDNPPEAIALGNVGTPFIFINIPYSLIKDILSQEEKQSIEANHELQEERVHNQKSYFINLRQQEMCQKLEIPGRICDHMYFRATKG